MADTLEILGTEYPDAIGIKATDDNNTELTFVRPQGTKSITTNGTGIDVTAYVSVDVSVSSTPTLQTKNKTYTAQETDVTEHVYADNGYDGLEEVYVKVNAISSSYVGSGITRRDSTDLSASGATVTAPAGYYSSSASKTIPNVQYVGALTPHFYVDDYILDENSGTLTTYYSLAGTDYPVYQAGYASTSDTVEMYNQGSDTYQLPTQAGTTITPTTSSQTAVAKGKFTTGAVTVSAMPTGTAGTPTATKGTVSNHSVSVTPSVTNTTGYITGSTKTGTAVTVTASELASGNKEITANGTNIDVVGYSTVSVDVQGGGGSSIQVDSAEAELSSASSSISITGLSGEPTAFILAYDDDIATGTPARVGAVVFDGASLHGQTVTNTSNAQASYDTGFTKSYSNGTLTVTATTAQFLSGAYVLRYTYNGGAVDTLDVQVGSGATSITFTGLEDEPVWWACIFKSNFGTSSGYQRVMYVSTNGENDYGMSLDSSAHLSGMNFSSSYSNGSFTISSSGTNAGGYFHQPGYYQLTYAYDASGNYQTKSVSYTPSTSQQTQTITADSQYDALKKVNVTVDAMPSMTLPTASSATSSGTSKATITPSSSTQYLNIPTGYNATAQYYTISATSGGSVTVKTTTMTNNSATATQIQFTSLSAQPKAFFCRCTSNLSRSSSNRYYYIADIRWDGSSTGGVVGNKYYVYNGQYSNQTTGYSQSYSSGTLTLTTTGSQTASPGSFYNGTYELVYIY